MHFYHWEYVTIISKHRSFPKARVEWRCATLRVIAFISLSCDQINGVQIGMPLIFDENEQECMYHSTLNFWGKPLKQFKFLMRTKRLKKSHSIIMITIILLLRYNYICI